jgi:hypothetical protein
MNQPDLNRLKSQLLTTGLSNKDNPLFQVINQLIGAVKQLQDAFLAQIAAISSSISNISNVSIIGSGPPGMDGMDGIDGMDGFSNLSGVVSAASVSSVGYWTPLTDGDVDETDLIFANGESIEVFVPTP